ncbi:MAG: hypothetical protein LBU11_11210, partial [Zoogloeaceae bacterium]|nr:hypothetical protein [Zoogloeaceae bacterium]
MPLSFCPPENDLGSYKISIRTLDQIRPAVKYLASYHFVHNVDIIRKTSQRVLHVFQLIQDFIRILKARIKVDQKQCGKTLVLPFRLEALNILLLERIPIFDWRRLVRRRGAREDQSGQKTETMLEPCFHPVHSLCSRKHMRAGDRML